jgi:hypothetical protein
MRKTNGDYKMTIIDLPMNPVYGVCLPVLPIITYAPRPVLWLPKIIY